VTEGQEKGGQRIGILGGSFDPVHNGHIHLARTALQQLALDTILFMPAAVPPHKIDWPLASAEDRLAMLELAVSREKGMRIDATEIRRGGISFTWETLSLLEKSRPDTRLFFLIGSDSLAELATWRRIDRIAAMATFAVLARDATGLPPTPRDLEKALKGIPLQAVPLQAEPIPVSSTDIRSRLSRRDSIAGLVPDAVADYIGRKGIYRD